MSSSTSPRHSCSSNGEEERPRFFDSKAKNASVGPMLKLFPIFIPSDGTKMLPITSSTSISVTAKVASESSTTTLFLSYPKFGGSEKNACYGKVIYLA
ncbi:hypothetical protein J1N35_019440 [Gossypium stocksii]|uniref:Uncharacterized protein n=1 Tax=Gossypium stocksii TaxID=47602 RepID=A0A9D4A7L5_9ROSI|nr:hypothetical protein J1N35_019440 [Gossypium stocksii]